MFEAMQEHEQTTEFPSQGEHGSRPAWVADARATLPGRGRYLVCRMDDEEPVVHPIPNGWSRIGRSVAADLRIDDPSVSRRHALIVSEEGKAVRVLDDRSLNGIFVNGAVVEWGSLADGDELRVGRYQLFFLEL